MKSALTTRNLLIAGGWLATAAGAFSVGRMGGSHETVAPKGGSSANPSATSTYPGGGFTAADRERLGVAVTTENGVTRVMTVGEVTGGQPLEDWLKKVMSQDDELYRMQNFMKLLEALNTPEDIKAALKIIGSQRGDRGGRGGGGFGGGRFTEFAMLMAKFTQLDAKGAIAFATEQEGGEKFMATATALRTWSRLAPDAALEWAKTEGAKLQMEFGGRDGRGPGGPGGQTAAEEAPKDNFALLSVVSNLAKSDLDKALSTASSMEMGRMSGRAVETLASEFISQRGAESARKYADSLPAGQFKDQFIGDIAGKMAQTDPKGTADWAMGMEGDMKRRALGQAIQEWAQKDAAAAGSYLSTVAPSVDTDSARSALADQVSNKDPKTAWAWAQTITDPERQIRTLESVARDWRRTDAAGLQQAVAETALPDNMKARLTSQGRDGGGFRGGGGNFGGGATGGAPAATGGGGRRGR